MESQKQQYESQIQFLNSQSELQQDLIGEGEQISDELRRETVQMRNENTKLRRQMSVMQK